MDQPAATLRSGLALCVIAAFIVVSYLPSFSVPFVFDDVPNIVLNTLVQPEHWSDLRLALDGPGDRNRPVAKLTFAVNHLLGGLDPRGFHLFNLLVHLANALVLFFLLRLLASAPQSPSRLGQHAIAFAFAATLIWAVHPVNTQAVTYIVQRIASLATLFYLIGLLVYALWRSGHLSLRWALPLFLLMFGLGSQTKLIVATLPAAALLIDIALYSGRIRRAHWIAVGGVLLCTLTLAVVYASQYWGYLTEPSPRRDFSGIERLMTQGRVIWHYLTLLAWPDADRLQLDYDFSVSRGLLDPVSTLAAAVGLAAVSLLALSQLRRHPWPAMGWLFFLLALSVESSVILLELVFEHRLYLPSSLLLAGLLSIAFTIPMPRASAWRSMAVLIIAGVLSWQTIDRNRQWQDLGRFWASDLDRGASLYRAALNGGIAHLRAGESERAMALFELIEREGAATTDRARGKVAQLKGEALFRRGEIESALVEFRRALEWRPGWTRTAYFAAMSLVQLDRVEDARDVLQQMQRHHPDSVFTVSLEAELLRVERSAPDAIAFLRSRLEQGPAMKALNRSFLNLHLGNMLYENGDKRLAAERYRIALEQHPENWAAASALTSLTGD